MIRQMPCLSYPIREVQSLEMTIQICLQGRGVERGWPHLTLLHVAVPAMTVGAVQRLLLEQEQLSRSRRQGQPASAAFADGGFPLGLAFLLMVRPEGVPRDLV